MSGTIPPHAQGRWRAQRGRDTPGPNRVPTHPIPPPPGSLPAVELHEEDEMNPQKDPSGGSGGIGGPKSPPAAPKTPPPPNDPPAPPEK